MADLNIRIDSAAVADIENIIVTSGTGEPIVKVPVPQFKADILQGVPTSQQVTAVGTTANNALAVANAAIPSAQKGAANGVASLDSSGKLPTNQRPTLYIANATGTGTQQDPIVIEVADLSANDRTKLDNLPLNQSQINTGFEQRIAALEVAGGGNINPSAPTLTADDTADTLSASSPYPIVYSLNNGTYVPFDGTAISVGNVARAQGYWKFKVPAATGRNESPVAESPAFTVSGGGGNITPSAPTVTGNDSANTLVATHNDYAASEIEYSTNGGTSYQQYTGVINVGNVALAQNAYLFRIKAATGRNASATAGSPAFTVSGGGGGDYPTVTISMDQNNINPTLTKIDPSTYIWFVTSPTNNFNDNFPNAGIAQEVLTDGKALRVDGITNAAAVGIVPATNTVALGRNQMALCFYRNLDDNRMYTVKEGALLQRGHFFADNEDVRMRITERNGTTATVVIEGSTNGGTSWTNIVTETVPDVAYKGNIHLVERAEAKVVDLTYETVA